MAESSEKHSTLAGGVLASVLAALILTSVQYIASQFIADSLLASLVASGVGVVVLVLGLRLRIINIFELIGTRYLDTHTGIVKVYPSLHHAFDDLKSGFAEARRIDLLLHIGRQEFGVRDALFSELLRSRLGETDLELRILHIDSDSPYLSEDRAQRLGKRRAKWVRDVQYVRDQIRELCGEHENIRLASHREPFVWRMFVFDNEMFVSGYLHNTKNDEQAPVFKIRSGSNSLYAAFRSHYDHLWRVYAGDLRGKV